MGMLVCRSCQGAVASGAITCPKCGAVLQTKGLNAIGISGGLLLIAGFPACALTGVVGIGMIIIGALLVLIGRSNSPKWGVLRKFVPSDYDRLGLAPGVGAWFTPPQANALTLAVFAIASLVAWSSVRSNFGTSTPLLSKAPTGATSSSSQSRSAVPATSTRRKAKSSGDAPKQKRDAAIKSIAEVGAKLAGSVVTLHGYFDNGQLCDRRCDLDSANVITLRDPQNVLPTEPSQISVRVRVRGNADAEVLNFAD